MALRKHENIGTLLNLPGTIRQEDGSRDLVEAFFQSTDTNEDNELTVEELLSKFATATTSVDYQSPTTDTEQQQPHNTSIDPNKRAYHQSDVVESFLGGIAQQSRKMG
eukprot:SAG31_NODE_13647_length_855_cov_1.740741_3_plen_107_part_01